MYRKVLLSRINVFKLKTGYDLMSKMQKDNKISVPNGISFFCCFGALINQKPPQTDRPFQAKVGIYKLN